MELNPKYAAIAKELIAFAGLSEKSVIIVGATDVEIPQLASKIGSKHIDFLFIDHWKVIYLRDLKLVEQHGLLRKGSVIVADNVIFPGAPEYLEYVRDNKAYTSTMHPAHVEYSDAPDGVEVTVVN